MSYLEPLIPFYIIFGAVFVVLIVLAALYEHRKNEEIIRYQQQMDAEIRYGVFGGKFISADEFEEKWIVGGSPGKSGFTGYKYNDTSGCYVILMFDHEVQDGNWKMYDDIYIGQSVNMCKRVHTHFNGKGNGDVYADVRNGKHVYVQFKPCEEEEMNDLEKTLIAAFKATESYNYTRGGGARREAHDV